MKTNLTDRVRSLLVALLGSITLLPTFASDPVPALAPASPEAISRWQDKRFAMFIHWGPVSLTG
ncbi:MAG TPA: hypothetical protein VHI52_16170, partial [Verrucomicrobiae bacterium]|nr:hypothetical protein [Verrucomicrobiae bacterium]